MARVKLKDVADRVGLSVNTVSRALRDMDDIGEATKKKIRRVAKSLGYTPNRAARMLRTNRSETLGVVITDIANPVFGGMVKGIEATARSHGYTIFLCDTNESYAEEEEAVRNLLGRGVDGLLLVPCMEKTGTVRLLESKGVPYALLGRHFPDVATNVVSTDDVRGGYLAGRHLVERGHRRLLYVTGPLRISSARERLEGLRKAVGEAGLPADAVRVAETSASIGGAYDVCQALLDGRQFTGVFCFSDFMAFGVLKALKERGVQVPAEVAVVGFDDIELSGVFTPALTTIDMSGHRLGERATELVIQEIRRPKADRSRKQIILEPNLVVREST
jgi:LacI family transcriptional regulator